VRCRTREEWVKQNPDMTIVRQHVPAARQTPATRLASFGWVPKSRPVGLESRRTQAIRGLLLGEGLPRP
jgi:hypothetical protein